MWYQEISDRNAVIKALEEFKRRGRDEFLEEYKFSRARIYFILYNGGYYDAKPILYAAYKHQFGILPVPSHASSGVIHTVGPKLESMGFQVVRKSA